MELIDTHTHIFLPEFREDRELVISRAEQMGVSCFLMPNVDEQTLPDLMETALLHPKSCYPMIGLHPTSVNHATDFSLSWVYEGLRSGRFIAVGEVGLDLYWDKTFKTEQERVFRLQFGMAREFMLPVVIHSRESMPEIISILNSEPEVPAKGVFHCFSGTIEEARWAVEKGYYLGIGGPYTYKKSNLPEIVRSVGLSHIVLETDSPYLPPVPFRGKRNESSYIRLVAESIALNEGVSLEEVASITSKNARNLFKLGDC